MARPVVVEARVGESISEHSHKKTAPIEQGKIPDISKHKAKVRTRPV